jgi:hypothetical protein
MPIHTHPPARLRSSLANAAWAVEERVVWSAGDALRSTADAVKWAAERVAWPVERKLVWPLQERLDWEGPGRKVAAVGLVLVAAVAGVAGLLWAAPNDGGSAAAVRTPVRAAPVTAARPSQAAVGDARTLQGAPPVFAPPATASAAKVATGKTVAAQSSASDAKAGSASASSAASGATGQPAGPAALKVARQFSDAFVLYETGQTTAAVRTAFGETAAPRLAHSLLKRPPRLPANVEVPQAKVLNVVAAPSREGAYPVSVSLLRLGVTSDLRLEMSWDKRGGKWQVEEILG